MLRSIQTLKKIIRDIVKTEIEKTKGMDIFQIERVNAGNAEPPQLPLTFDIKRLNVAEYYNNVEMIGLGLSNARGQIMLPKVNDLVVVSFVGESNRPMIIGSVFDTFTGSVEDAKLDVRPDEYIVLPKPNGSYLYINDDEDIIIKASNSYVTIDKNGVVEVEGTEIKLGGSASAGIARLGDSIQVVDPGGSGTWTGTITSASSKSKSE